MDLSDYNGLSVRGNRYIVERRLPGPRGKKQKAWFRLNNLAKAKMVSELASLYIEGFKALSNNHGDVPQILECFIKKRFDQMVLQEMETECASVALDTRSADHQEIGMVEPSIATQHLEGLVEIDPSLDAIHSINYRESTEEAMMPTNVLQSSYADFEVNKNLQNGLFPPASDSALENLEGLGCQKSIAPVALGHHLAHVQAGDMQIAVERQRDLEVHNILFTHLEQNATEEIAQTPESDLELGPVDWPTLWETPIRSQMTEEILLRAHSDGPVFGWQASEMDRDFGLCNQQQLADDAVREGQGQGQIHYTTEQVGCFDFVDEKHISRTIISRPATQLESKHVASDGPQFGGQASQVDLDFGFFNQQQLADNTVWEGQGQIQHTTEQVECFDFVDEKHNISGTSLHDGKAMGGHHNLMSPPNSKFIADESGLATRLETNRITHFVIKGPVNVATQALHFNFETHEACVQRQLSLLDVFHTQDWHVYISNGSDTSQLVICIERPDNGKDLPVSPAILSVLHGFAMLPGWTVIA